MISGNVSNGFKAIIRLKVRDANGTELDVDAIIDTGFTGFLILPPSLVAGLNLVLRSRGSGILADGSIRTFFNYTANLEWDGTTQEILVSAVGDEPLVGMRLLFGHELRIAVEPGGLVEIKPLP